MTELDRVRLADIRSQSIQWIATDPQAVNWDAAFLLRIIDEYARIIKAMDLLIKSQEVELNEIKKTEKSKNEDKIRAIDPYPICSHGIPRRVGVNCTWCAVENEERRSALGPDGL